MIKRTITMLSLSMFLSICAVNAQHKKQLENEKNLKIETAKTAVEKLIFNYQEALNTSDVDKVLQLYGKDGVFMPQGYPSVIGQEELRGAYEFVFKTLQLNIKFQIDEIVLINENYAFVRTTSGGTQLINASGLKMAEENRELFILKKEKEEWKIARYIFNKTK